VEIGGQETYKKFWQQAIDKNPALTLFVIDISREDDLMVFKTFREDFPNLEKFLLVANKIDLINGTDHPILNKLKVLGTEVIFCSILTGENFCRLSEYVAEFCSKHAQETQRSWKSSFNVKSASSDTNEGVDTNKATKLLEDYDGNF
jgi:50S ribosomal subunit-associated GTPase HflX